MLETTGRLIVPNPEDWAQRNDAAKKLNDILREHSRSVLCRLSLAAPRAASKFELRCSSRRALDRQHMQAAFLSFDNVEPVVEVLAGCDALCFSREGVDELSVAQGHREVAVPWAAMSLHLDSAHEESFGILERSVEAVDIVAGCFASLVSAYRPADRSYSTTAAQYCKSDAKVPGTSSSGSGGSSGSGLTPSPASICLSIWFRCLSSAFNLPSLCSGVYPLEIGTSGSSSSSGGSSTDGGSSSSRGSLVGRGVGAGTCPGSGLGSGHAEFVFHPPLCRSAIG